MADRYQGKPFPADDYDRGDQHDAGGSDPLAELARLIGQTDPFGATGKSNPAPLPPARMAVRPARSSWVTTAICTAPLFLAGPVMRPVPQSAAAVLSSVLGHPSRRSLPSSHWTEATTLAPSLSV